MGISWEAGRAAGVAACLAFTCACAGSTRPAIAENDLEGIGPQDWFELEAACNFDDGFRQLLTRLVLERAPENPARDVALLALSGGGQNGAFGAGILEAWPTVADGALGRPAFDVVTGVSAGALQATVAFLDDPELNAELLHLFRTLGDDTVWDKHGPFAIFRRSGMAVYEGLAHAVEEIFTDEVIDRVAEEHERGRTLWVGTTNLDTARFVDWNLTYVATRASSGNPDFYRLYRRLLLASASIPIAVEPQYVNGYMHVDGATLNNVFLPSFPDSLDALILDGQFKIDLYVVINGRLEIDPRVQEPRVLSIGGRAVDLLTKQNTYNGLVRMRESFYRLMQRNPDFDRNRLQPHLAFIPRGFEARADPDLAFDTAYMCELADFGGEYARESRWISQLPESALGPPSTQLQPMPLGE